MCGIAGWYEKGVDFRKHRKTLAAMSESLSRRGPDDHGCFGDDSVCIIHRRLAVIDVENGRQPMAASWQGKKAAIVYNGELYNSPELRGELQDAGMVLQTQSDTELVLASYLLWGEECVEKLNGIFAFAVRDEKEDLLFLARDRIGVKPLFFYPFPNGLLFASEVNCLLQHPYVEPEIDEQGLCELFLIGPGRSSGQGIYRNIGELLPGECAVFDGKRLRRRRYFTLHAREHTDDLNRSLETVRYLLTDSIERQLVSDVPLCCFLSGGLDSSIISYTAAAYRRRNGMEPIDTYSIDYAENDRYFQKSLFQPTPDSEFIGIMTDAIGSRHHHVTLDNRELFHALKPAVDARDFPGMTDVDASLLLFCRAIREDFTVALSGECADELFGGYPWYHNREILFEDCFPWARSTGIRRSILKQGFLPHGEEYVRQKYLDTCTHTEKLPTDSPINARMREMFALNFEWFMQTLLDNQDPAEKRCCCRETDESCCAPIECWDAVPNPAKGLLAPWNPRQGPVPAPVVKRHKGRGQNFLTFQTF